MNAEYLLDAVGLLDDDLIQESETYTVRSRKAPYGTWITLAASLALVITLGYGVTHIRMGGGGAAPSQETAGGAANSPASGAPASSGMPTAPSGTAVPEGPENFLSGGSVSASGGDEPDAPGSSVGGENNGDWLSALRVDGTVYWDTGEYIKLEPEEETIRYTTSFTNSAEPEEDGQANFLPVGLAYVMLEDSTVAVRMEETDSWRIFNLVPPWEQP